MIAGGLFQFFVGDLEIIQNGQCFILHHDFVKKHPAAPGAAAGSKFTLKNGRFQPGRSQIPCGNKGRGAAADNGDIKL